MRGGTSKAVFLKSNELPADPELRDRIILAIFGSPDVRQIDGLGGSDITTSKVAIIGPPTRDDADVDYTFGQVSLTRAMVDWSSNCGNISSAVGPYAIDEGMVRTSEPITNVRIHFTNSKTLLQAWVAVRNGCAAVEGDFSIPGVPGTGSRINLDYSRTSGSATGKLLPTGNVADKLYVEALGEITASIVDIANPVVFVPAESLGASGTESRPEIMANSVLMAKIEAVRSAAAELCGFVTDWRTATELSPLRPMLSFVRTPVDYADYTSGTVIKSAQVDFLARNIFNQMAVEAYTGTGSICTAVAAMIDGTIVNRVAFTDAGAERMVRFGHPRGVIEIEVAIDKSEKGFTVRKAVLQRTARRIMDGYVYVRKSLIG
jgi:hypothetical protein